MKVAYSLTLSGFDIVVDQKSYPISYPAPYWRDLPVGYKHLMAQQITYGFTNYLPLMLGQKEVVYGFEMPILESFFFKNQFYDLLSCEVADGVSALSYLRDFYNISSLFAHRHQDSTFDESAQIFNKQEFKTGAVLPFTFGKESLVTFGLCRELQVPCVLLYTQEPVQPYEYAYKKPLLKKFTHAFLVPTVVVDVEAGIFRNGKAFGLKKPTEIGWGVQTTLLALLSIPILFHHRYSTVLFGSEQANNEFAMRSGWKEFLSYDQTSHWTTQQNAMVELLTGGKGHVASSLEALEEINIFYMLHRRYPELGLYQFSCFASKPLVEGSQWCHNCYKCTRMYLFALGCGIAPESIGFKHNVLEQPDILNHYFGTDYATGSVQDLDFAFYLLLKRGIKSKYVTEFKAKRFKHLHSWSYYVDYYTKLHPDDNLFGSYRDRLLTIFKDELGHFKKLLKGLD